ncbi:hypothetical protein JPSP44_00940 [Staphylococcus pseudintermedius]
MTLITSRCKNKGLSVGRFAFAIVLTSIFKLRKDYNFLNFHLMVESDAKKIRLGTCATLALLLVRYLVCVNTLKYMKLFI